MPGFNDIHIRHIRGRAPRAVVSTDLESMDPEMALDVQVEMTVVHGKALFERS